MSLENIMNTELIICDVNTPLSGVSMIMNEYNIGFIPIHDNKKIIGVVTDRDIVCRAIKNKCNYNEAISNYMTKNVISIDSSKKIEDALNVMSKNKIKRLIVTNGKKIVGIISLSNLINHVEDNLIIDTIKKIWNTNDNKNNYDTSIDDFYL